MRKVNHRLLKDASISSLACTCVLHDALLATIKGIFEQVWVHEYDKYYGWVASSDHHGCEA